MNKDQIIGPLREIAFAAGVALVTFGVTSQETVELISGLLLSVITLILAFRANEGTDVIVSLVRKVLSGSAGALVAWGKLDPAKAEALTGFALTLFTAGWSFKSKSGGTGGTGSTPLWIFALLALSFLQVSCTGIMSGVTGQPIATETVKTPDGSEFKVATADILRAKSSPPDTAWGLYNAGLVAQRAREVIDTGK